MQRPHVLIIDDEQNFRELLGEALLTEGYKVTHAATARAGLGLARTHAPPLILLDQNLPDGSGLDLLPELRSNRANPVVVVMTAYGECDLAVTAIKGGAFEYLSKPFGFDELLEVLARASVGALSGIEAETGLVGQSPAMVELDRKISRLARTPVDTILIEGESGTGKELVARALHTLSPRASKPLLAVNCAALTETLLLTELFGHERGAFTDARERKRGLFEAAQGGTLFLDEIGEMGARAQASLLRALEERVIRRVGGTEDVPVDIRIIAATNRHLPTAIQQGTFRQDLYHRLNVVKLEIPPLRERVQDISLLARHFIAAAATRYGEASRTLAPETEAVLKSYSWPGNVRELRNFIERAYAVTADPVMLPEHLPPRQDPLVEPGAGGADAVPTHMPFQDAKQKVIDRFERRYLEELLAHADGNVTRAADGAGVLRQVLQRLLKRHDIDAAAYRT